MERIKMANWNKPNDYTTEEALAEAARCLSCKKPMCETGCPAGMRIRDFILEIKNGNLEAAREILDGCSSLSSICSVVCPHESQCEGHCIRNKMKTMDPIHCGSLEKFVQNNTKGALKKESLIPNVKVAIIGAGPAGLSAAKEIALAGGKAVVFEKEAVAGGVMTYGIPSYRLDYADVKKIQDDLESIGVEFKFNTYLRESDIVALKKDYDYVFIAAGLTKVRTLGIPNDNLPECLNALEYLVQSNFNVKLNKGEAPKIYGDVIVVGAGNVAMDAARTSVRLGAKSVTVVYRRTMEEAPAAKHEINDAIEEGVVFKFLTNPVEVYNTDGHVKGCKCEVMELGEPDASGRRKPVGTGTYVDMPCDFIISAIGQVPDKDMFDANTITTDHGYVVADETLKTSVDGIYTGGDIFLGAQTVVKAMKNGRDFAKMVIEAAKN